MEKRGVFPGGRAQASMEFLLILGFAMLMTIPLIIIFYQQTDNLNKEITASQADKVASEIRDAADEVYYLGVPSKKTIIVFMPESVNSVIVSGEKIEFTVESSSGDYDVVKWSVANLTGAIQPFSGVHRITLEAVPGFVNIVDS